MLIPCIPLNACYLPDKVKASSFHWACPCLSRPSAASFPPLSPHPSLACWLSTSLPLPTRKSLPYPKSVSLLTLSTSLLQWFRHAYSLLLVGNCYWNKDAKMIKVGSDPRGVHGADWELVRATGQCDSCREQVASREGTGVKPQPLPFQPELPPL